MIQISKKTNIIATLALIFAAALWGTSFTVIKTVLTSVPVMYVLGVRYTLAALLMAVFFARRTAKLKWKTVLVGAIGGAALFVANLLQTYGCKYTTAGKAAFITTMYVVLVPFLLWLLYKKKPDKWSIIAAFVVFAGVGLLSITNGEGGVNIGDIFAILCGAFYALNIAMTAHFAEEHDPIMLTMLQMAFGGIAGLVLAPFVDGVFPTAALTLPTILQLAYIAVFCSFIAFAIQNTALKYLDANKVSLLVSLEAVFAVIIAAIVLHERPTPRMYAGFALIFLGIVISETKLSFFRKKRQQNE